MDRNLDRRIEAVVPVEDGEARARLAEIIDIMLADDRRSWQLGADGTWRRTAWPANHPVPRRIR
jgi:polyphosphate kinase